MSDQATLQFRPVPPDPPDSRRRRGWPAALIAALATLAVTLPFAVFYLPTGLEPAGTAWPPVNTENGSIYLGVDPPPAGATTSHTFAFRRPATLASGQMDVDSWGLGMKSTQLRESIPWNNTATVTIRTAD